MSSPNRRPSPGPRPESTVVAVEPAAAQPVDGAVVVTRQGWRVVRIARAGARATSGSIEGSGRIWRASREARAERIRSEPRFDSSSWVGASIVMATFGVALWVVQIVNAARGYDLNRFALLPREQRGLWGILTEPFLHASYNDMLSDTLPVLLIGWVVMLAGLRVWIGVTAVVVLVGGALTWVIAPSHELVLGCSGLIFGWLGYLVARAIFSRNLRWIVTAAMVLLIFGALLGQLVPVAHSHQSWQVHVAGFVAGAGIAWLLHPRSRSARGKRRRSHSCAVS